MTETRELLIPAAAKLLTLNAERRIHYMERARIVKAWRSTASVMALVSKLPRFSAVLIVADIEQAHGKLADGGAHFPCVKACIDGLVDAHVIDDDDPLHVQQLVQNPPTRGEFDQVKLTIKGPLAPRTADYWRRSGHTLDETRRRREERIAREQANCLHAKRVMGTCIECGQGAP